MPAAAASTVRPRTVSGRTSTALPAASQASTRSASYGSASRVTPTSWTVSTVSLSRTRIITPSQAPSSKSVNSPPPSR